MQAWPIEEAYVVRPLGSLALAALLPILADAILSRVTGGDLALLARARVPTRAASLAMAWAIGATALGPSLAEAQAGIASHAAATICLTAAVFADRWRIGSGDLRPLVGGYLIALSVSASLSVVTPHAVFLGALIIGIASALAFRTRHVEGSAVGPWIGGALAATLFALLALPVPLTAIRLEDAPQAGDATWRLRVDPWDENAMLASGWAARRRGDLDRASASAREAVVMGLGQAPALELESEVLAARGACEEARAAFDEALRVRASDAFEGDSLLAPLVLGGFQLPPTLVTACGGLDALPGLDDIRTTHE